MNYSKIISYFYALIAIILGTYIGLYYIVYYYKYINFYNNKQLKETTGIIKNIDCYKNGCYSKIEYTANNVKYIEEIETPNNLKIGDKVKIKYNSKAEGNIYYFNDINNKYIYLILLIIYILLLWIFTIIGIIFSNKYILFIIYAIIGTITTYIIYTNY